MSGADSLTLSGCAKGHVVERACDGALGSSQLTDGMADGSQC